MLDDKLKALWTRISPPQKAAFFGCFLSGYLVHLYVFTNIIPNSDGLSRIFDPQQMTVSGRWFLHFASYFNGFTQMPAVIGLFSVLFLALAAALAVSLLGIRSRALSALSGALMAAFPAVGYTFLYLFTASAYCFAIFLAVLSVSLARRGRWHWLAGCLLLACSMGTYQAYVTVAIGLSLLVIFWETLDPSASFSATLRLGVRLMLFLAAGAVLYYGILLVFLQVKDLELLSYLGMPPAPAIPSPASPGCCWTPTSRWRLSSSCPAPPTPSPPAGWPCWIWPRWRWAGAASCCAWGRRGSGGRAGAPWAGWPCWPCSPWASTSARSSAPGPPPPP